MKRSEIMAILGYIGSGTYTVVDNIYYSDTEKRVSFVVNVFSNSLKTKKLAVKEFYIQNGFEVPAVKSMDATQIPADATYGDKFIISENCNEYPWDGYRKQLASKSKTGWTYTSTQEGTVVLGPDQKYYAMNHEGSFYETDCLYDSRIWDEFFSKEKIVSGGSLQSQCYRFLLQRVSDFSDCTSG
jgi:hypothetical protein